MSKNRDVNSIILKGLNKRDTINSIEDGWCEKSHNVVFREGRLQSVNDYKCNKSFDLEGYTILYKHPISPDGEYIALKGNQISHIKIVGDEIILSLTLMEFSSEVEYSSITVSHFEETLFVNYTILDREYSQSFSYENERYTAIDIESLRDIDNVDIKYDYYIPAKESANDVSNRMITFFTGHDTSGNKYVSSVNKRYETIYADIENSNYIHGAIYLIFALKMKDGSVVRNSRIHMVDGEYGRNNMAKSLYRTDSVANQYRYYKDVYGFKMTLNFSEYIPKIENPLVKSIMVYSTRNNPLYDFDGIHNNYPTNPSEIESYAGTTRFSAKYALSNQNIDSTSQPFYQIAEIDYKTSNAVTLTATDYKNIETKPIYTPMVAPHNYFSEGKININNRLHQYNITAQLYKPSFQLLDTRSVTIEKAVYNKRKSIDYNLMENIGVSVTLNVRGEKITTSHTTSGHLYWKVKSIINNITEYYPDPYIIIPNIISYPDVRATKIDLFFTKVTRGVKETILIRSYDLQPSTANNYAIYRKLGQDALLSYDLIVTSNFENNNYIPPTGKSTFKIKNQLMVSEPGKPHLYYPQHIYYIGELGETVIESANMPIDQLTESRFGQYPLYLFSSSGIYAMEQGTDATLYNNIIKVNNDIIERGTNSVSADGSLYYFTSGGLMRLSGHVSKVASDVMSGHIKSFMEGAKLYYIPRHNELLVVNKQFNYAYICSLLYGVWSSRDFSGSVIGYSTFIKDNSLYDLFEEDTTKPLDASITTRELRLGSRHIKRLERLRVNILTKSEYKVVIYASMDGVLWCKIASETNCNYIKRSSSSWRWFKISIDGKDFTIDTLTTESYTRFVAHI